MLISRYYEIVVMKINKTSLDLKPAHTVQNLSTYEEAGFNQPYVTTVLEPNYFETYDVRNFTIGMNTFFFRLSLNICASVKVEVLKYKRAMACNGILVYVKNTNRFL